MGASLSLGILSNAQGGVNIALTLMTLPPIAARIRKRYPWWTDDARKNQVDLEARSDEERRVGEAKAQNRELLELLKQTAAVMEDVVKTKGPDPPNNGTENPKTAGGRQSINQPQCRCEEFFDTVTTSLDLIHQKLDKGEGKESLNQRKTESINVDKENQSADVTTSHDLPSS